MGKKILSLVIASILIMSTVIVPSEATDRLILSVDIGDTGNVFYGKDQGINVSLRLTNPAYVDIDTTVQVSVYNDRDVLLEKISKEMLIKAGSSCEDVIDLTSVECYGYYGIKVKVIDKPSGECITSYSTEFAVVNIPDSMKKNDKLGAVIHNRMAAYGDSSENLNFADKAGFSNVRSEQSWEVYESKKNVYALTNEYKGFLHNERDKKMGHLEILAYGNELYANSFPPKGTDELTAFAAYAKNIVRDLLKEGPKEKIEVELWNEWNNFDNDSSTWDWFNPRNLNTSDYSAFCAAVYPAVKEAAEEAGVDVNVWGIAACGITWNSFIPYALKAGAGKYMDGISLHPYSNQECPEDFLVEDMEWLYRQISGAYKPALKVGNTIVREENFDLSLKDNLCASEWGWPSAGGTYPDELGQASYFVRFNILNEKNGYFNKAYYYTINDGGIGDNIEQKFGLIRSKDAQIPYQPKPAYLAAANYNSLMIGAKYVKSVAISDEITAYQFKLSDGQDLVVAWKIHDSSQVNTPAAADTENAAITLGAQKVKVIDMYGNEQEIEGNGTYGFTFDKTPVYIVGEFSSLSAGTYEDSIVRVRSVIYDKNKQTLLVDGEAAEDVTIRIVKDKKCVTAVTDRVSEGYFSKTISVGSLADGEYEISVSSGAQTKAVRTFTKVSCDYANKQSSFVPGVIAVYNSESNTVTVSGEVADWTEGEKITIACASLKTDGNKSENEYNVFGANAVDNIVYIGETTINNGAFEKTFSIPAGGNGKYTVRCGGTYVKEGVQTNTQSSKNAIVCTFVAQKDTNTVTASAMLKNASNMDEEKRATLIIAQYDSKGAVLAVSLKGYSMSKNATEPTKAEISMPLNNDATFCKAFIWDEMSELVPLVDLIEIR